MEFRHAHRIRTLGGKCGWKCVCLGWRRNGGFVAHQEFPLPNGPRMMAKKMEIL